MPSNQPYHTLQVGLANGFFNDFLVTARFAYDSEGRTQYVGWAKPGAATSISVWLIRRFAYDSSSRITDILFADGDSNFDNEWDERENLSYS